MTQKFNKKDAEKVIKGRADKVGDDDVRKLLDEEETLFEKVLGSSLLGGLINDIRDLFNMVSDYWNERYRDTPWYAIAAAVVALLYVINPFDVIPDVIPVVGYVDDFAVVSLCLEMIHEDIEKYRRWRDRA